MKDLELKIKKFGISSSKSRATERDKILEELRNDGYKNEWFRNSVIREFLNKFVADSRFVPDVVRKAIESSKQEVDSLGIRELARQKFLDAIDGRGRIKDVGKFTISANDLMTSARNASEVMKTFAEKNVHNSRYYFTKFTEWFITQCHIREYEKPTVVDIGSAYYGFGKYAKNATDAQEINLVDILNPPGRIELEDRVFQIGSDAAKIGYIPDEYAEIVCLHNAIEHFACGSDDGCLREIQRMLRPGGKAFITPFFFEGRYAISLNPIPCFFYESASDVFVDYLASEHLKRGAHIRYSYGMVSPYAHIYDYPTIERKLESNCPDLKPSLFQVSLKKEALDFDKIFGIKFSEDLYEKPTFFFLVLEKPDH
jgi:ubiquinone/menaquinone biosynthesis C-methylase UbiE